jgi:hypothetical protein
MCLAIIPSSHQAELCKVADDDVGAASIEEVLDAGRLQHCVAVLFQAAACTLAVSVMTPSRSNSQASYSPGETNCLSRDALTGTYLLASRGKELGVVLAAGRVSCAA